MNTDRRTAPDTLDGAAFDTLDGAAPDSLDGAAFDRTAGDPALIDQKMGLLYSVYDDCGGDTHRAVLCSALIKPGMTQNDIQALVQRLVAEKMLEHPHSDQEKVCLTPEAVKTLAAFKQGRR